MKFKGLINFSVLALILGGCSSEPPPKPKPYYPPAVTKYAPEPVYNRLKTAYLPSPLPERSPGIESSPSNNYKASIKPKPLGRDLGTVSKTKSLTSQNSSVLYFDFQNATLEEIAQKLSKSIGYDYYCSSLLAKRKISVSLKGNADNIAKELAKKENIVAVVDHSNKEVRFIARADEDIEGS